MNYRNYRSRSALRRGEPAKVIGWPDIATELFVKAGVIIRRPPAADRVFATSFWPALRSEPSLPGPSVLVNSAGYSRCEKGDRREAIYHSVSVDTSNGEPRPRWQVAVSRQIPEGVSRSQIPHAAFYGRTNARGINAVHIIAQQYEQCATAAARRVAITAFFYDLPQPIDEITELAVRGASGPLRRDGGWDALAASATGTDRPFDLILCASLDRIARKPVELEARCSLARRNKLAIVSAEELPDVLRPCSAWARRFTREIIINANGYGNRHVRDIGEPARRIRERKVRRRPAGSPPDTEPQ